VPRKEEKKRIVTGITNFGMRVVPSAFVIAIILTFVVIILALIFTDSNPFEVIQYWGNGFWTLLTFAMQMTLIIVTGYILAVSPPIKKFIDIVTDIPKSPPQAVAMVALVSMTLSWINWGLGLIAAAFLVRSTVKKLPYTDYRLLVTAGYLGVGVTWHGGLSASAPLLIATPTHFMEKMIGIVPIGETIFHPLNIILLVVLIPFCCLLAWILHPSKEETITVDPATLDMMKAFTPPALPESPTIGQRLNHLSIFNYLVGAAGLVWLGWYLFTKGFMMINLNVVLFAFLMLGMILHKTPAALEKAALEGTEPAWGVILQFPFYAGIFGIMMGSGLANIIARWFVAISTPRSFPAIVYIYSCIMNYFVPSGGAKWALEAPYIVAAAKEVGVSMTNTVIPYAYGDMTTNLLQPFWALPLLGLTKLEFKDIIGFNSFFFLATFIVILISFFILPGIL
jgi:short-chain fatty acids transporter